MFFNTVISIDTSTSMIHNISTRALCLLLLLLSFMIDNTLSNIANSSMIKATIPSIIINTGTNRCRTAATTVTITVVVTITTITMIAINTIMIIITSTRLLLLLVPTFFIHLIMSANPGITTIIVSIVANVCVNSSDHVVL